ncbi:E4 ORFA [Porcine adenovirus 3]|uniref:E4 ORFA n=1 Tax=Porcine adenovirus A serotype 3 TaxID=35265 RepID=UPI00001D96DD|nr:E4 ORFA [Porcine adenovirus 3]
MSAGPHQQPGLLLAAGERPPVIHQNRIHLRTSRHLVLTSEQPSVILFNVLVYVPTGFAVFVRLSEIFQRRDLVSVSQYLLLPGINPLPPHPGVPHWGRTPAAYSRQHNPGLCGAANK